MIRVTLYKGKKEASPMKDETSFLGFLPKCLPSACMVNVSSLQCLPLILMVSLSSSGSLPTTLLVNVSLFGRLPPMLMVNIRRSGKPNFDRFPICRHLGKLVSLQVWQFSTRLDADGAEQHIVLPCDYRSPVRIRFHYDFI